MNNSSSSVSKKKNSSPSQGFSLCNVMVNYFILVMFVIFPLFVNLTFDGSFPFLHFDRGYYGIRHQKYYLFMIMGAITVIGEILLLFTEGSQKIRDKYNLHTRDDALSKLSFTDWAVLAFLFTAFLGVAFVLLFIIYSFGQAVLEYLAPLFNLPMDMIDTFNQVKWPTIMVGIFLIMVLLYAFIPNAKLHLRFIWPGALFATCGWMVLTQGFSVYVKYFARTVLSYGTIGTVIVVLFWLNFTCWVIMVGGIINATLEEMCFGEVKPKHDPIENFGKNAYNHFLKCKK